MQCPKCKQADCVKTRCHHLIQYWKCPACSADFRTYIHRPLTKDEVLAIVTGFKDTLSSAEISEKLGISPVVAVKTYLSFIEKASRLAEKKSKQEE